VLGKKCAGNSLENGLLLRTQLFLVIFWHGHHQYESFLLHSTYSRRAAENSSLAMVGATPYKLFLKVSWVNKQLASSDFTVKTRKKWADAKYGNSEAGRTS
jgi:hypothetical protein